MAIKPDREWVTSIRGSDYVLRPNIRDKILNSKLPDYTEVHITTIQRSGLRTNLRPRSKNDFISNRVSSPKY